MFLLLDAGSREIASSDHGTVTSSVGSFTDALLYNFQSYDHGQTIKCMARLPDGSWKSSYSQLNVVQCMRLLYSVHVQS